MKLTKHSEHVCEEMQQMMTQEEPWNAVNSILLNRAYLRDMVSSKQELRLLRNKILAYHGYRFQSKDLQEYFGKIGWYKPGNDNNAIKLDIIEQTNIQLIKSEEAERTEEVLGDEPYWETEEGVAECIREYFDAVNKTFAEGSGKSPFDLDKKYYSAYWNEVFNDDFQMLKGSWKNPTTGKVMSLSDFQEMRELLSWWPGSPEIFGAPNRNELRYQI